MHVPAGRAARVRPPRAGAPVRAKVARAGAGDPALRHGPAVDLAAVWRRLHAVWRPAVARAGRAAGHVRARAAALGAVRRV